MSTAKGSRSNRNKSSSKLVEDLLRKQPMSACFDDVASIARKLYKGINTPLSLKCLDALNSGEVDYLARIVVDPRDYQDASSYFLDVSAASFLRKSEFLGDLGKSKIDPKQEAIDSFFRSEKLCSETNERLELFLEGKVMPINLRIPRAIEGAKKIIRKALGRAPKLEDIKIRFGPGATSACKGESVTIADKLSAFPEMTCGSLHLVDAVKNSPVWFNLLARIHPGCLYKPHWFMDDFGNEVIHVPSAVIAPKLLRGNRFITVKKDAKTDRGICIEPHTLSCIQLAVGAIFTDALATLGIVKSVQQVVNGRLAREASLTGKLCTVDLDKASDTIARVLIKLLLPLDWYELLCSLRSEETEINNVWVLLEKFSSMGNGFTFELETLVFYSLARSVSNLVCGKNQTPVCTFGDDLIVDSNCFHLLRETLEFCGFNLNQSKTYVRCGFNESCGQDFFKGTDVRPYFLKGAPQYVTDWFGLANGIRRMGEKHSSDGSIASEFLSAWLRVISCIPSALRLHGPIGLGDCVIETDEKERWTFRAKSVGRTVKIKAIASDFSTYWLKVPHQDGIDSVRCLKPKTKRRPLARYCSATQYASLLYGCESTGFALRGEPETLQLRWANV